MPEKFFNQSGPANHIEQTKLQTIEDVQFYLITEEDPDFANALTIKNHSGVKKPEDLEKEARKKIIDSNWWLMKEWAIKGLPKEQISIKIDDLSIELYNYGKELTPSQMDETKMILSKLAQVSIPDQKSKVRYIAISDKDELNVNNDEDKRGYAFRDSKMIALYPRAMSPEPHRIPNTSSFAGTLGHEFGHIYAEVNDEFTNAWMKKFGWKALPGTEEIVSTSKQFKEMFAVEEPGRCITDYAQLSPNEDICESLSAVINNPAVLDKERRDFIMEQWFQEKLVEKEVVIDKKTSGDIKMPRVPEKIKYRVIDEGGILAADDEEGW